MNKTSYIILIIFILIITGGCVGNQKQSPETSRDSIYTVAHIQDLSIAQPHEAIALLDTAEQKKALIEAYDEILAVVRNEGVAA